MCPSRPRDDAVPFTPELRGKEDMNGLRELVLAALLLLAIPRNARTAETSSRAESFEPVVVVLTRFPGRTEIGNGFVVITPYFRQCPETHSHWRLL